MFVDGATLLSSTVIRSSSFTDDCETSFFFLGLAFGTILALNNVFCANLNPSSVILGITHGSYGIGGIIGPVMATAMVSNGILWSRFYFITMALRILCIGFITATFWTYQEDTHTPLLTTLEQTASREAAAEEEARSKLRNLGQALKNRVTIFGALFIFAYQGAEVSISGWFISFLIAYRGGDPAQVGYVTAGFWVSQTPLSSFLPLPPQQKTDDRQTNMTDRAASHLAASS